MTFDLEKIVKSKEAYRRRFAQLPFEEKLRMLDVLRDRLLAIRAARGRSRRDEDHRVME